MAAAHAIGPRRLTADNATAPAKAVSWARNAHHLPHLNPLGAGEITVKQAAACLGVSANVVYYWIETGHLSANRRPTGRIGIPWNRLIEADCRGRILQSGHLTPKPANRRRPKAGRQ